MKSILSFNPQRSNPSVKIRSDKVFTQQRWLSVTMYMGTRQKLYIFIMGLFCICVFWPLQQFYIFCLRSFFLCLPLGSNTVMRSSALTFCTTSSENVDCWIVFISSSGHRRLMQNSLQTSSVWQHLLFCIGSVQQEFSSNMTMFIVYITRHEHFGWMSSHTLYFAPPLPCK